MIGKTADGYRKDAAGCRENMENEMPLRVRGMQKEEEMTEGKYSIERLEEKIDYIFQNKDLIRQALTHSSYANERKINRIKDYERIEFLGDAVLEMVSSEFLYNNHEEMSEGQLTRRRAAMVCEPSLASCARDLGLDHYILLGKGEEMTGGRARDSIVSDVMEALIGAVYLDTVLSRRGRLSVVLCCWIWRTRRSFMTPSRSCRKRCRKREKTSAMC